MENHYDSSFKDGKHRFLYEVLQTYKNPSKQLLQLKHNLERGVLYEISKRKTVAKETSYET